MRRAAALATVAALALAGCGGESHQDLRTWMSEQGKGARGKLDQLPPIVILRLRNMTALDGSGLGALEDLHDELYATGRTLILCGVREQPAAVMRQAGFHEHIGDENFCPNIEAALRRAAEIQRLRAA